MDEAHRLLDAVSGHRLKAKAAKNDQSLRTIPLPKFALAALARHRALHHAKRIQTGEDWQETGLVFASTTGTPIGPSNLLRHFQQTLKLVKIGRRRFHDLRHTAASLLRAKGATLHEAKEILGHSQIAFTANLYGHAYTSVLQETVDRVGSLLSPEKKPRAPDAGSLGRWRKS